MVSKVFISYRRDDSAGHAGRLYDRLERELGRDHLIMDVDSIPLGANFVKVLDEEVAKCDVLLALIGPGWLDAHDETGNRRLENPYDFVRIEVGTALKRGIPVIPILLEGTRVPKADQLPDELKELALRNGLEVRHASFPDDMERLIRGLKHANDRHQSAAERSGGRIVNLGDETVGNVTGAKADSWLDFAPKPDALPAGKQWHVFLSYRSVNQHWVLALYDILNLLGYKVFLNQYVLTAATPLAIALGDALNASAGAIMIWSGSYADSEWCKQEFAKLETMQNVKRGFRYVIARIDESEISSLAATRLWIDFSKQREGPAGSGLLSLLYALKGQPLPAAAVKLAAEVDAQMREGLLSVEAARYAGDADALVALAETDDMAWTGSPMLLCSVAEELIAMKKIPEAITVLDRVEAAFPKALRPKQLRGLALARSQQTMKAQLLLGNCMRRG